MVTKHRKETEKIVEESDSFTVYTYVLDVDELSKCPSKAKNNKKGKKNKNASMSTMTSLGREMIKTETKVKSKISQLKTENFDHKEIFLGPGKSDSTCASSVASGDDRRNEITNDLSESESEGSGVSFEPSIEVVINEQNRLWNL